MARMLAQEEVRVPGENPPVQQRDYSVQYPDV